MCSYLSWTKVTKLWRACRQLHANSQTHTHTHTHIACISLRRSGSPLTCIFLNIWGAFLQAWLEMHNVKYTKTHLGAVKNLKAPLYIVWVSEIVLHESRRNHAILHTCFDFDVNIDTPKLCIPLTPPAPRFRWSSVEEGLSRTYTRSSGVRFRSRRLRTSSGRPSRGSPTSTVRDKKINIVIINIFRMEGVV